MRREPLINGWVKLELLGALDCLEANHHMRDGLAVPAHGVLGFLRCHFSDLSFINFLRFLDSQTFLGRGNKGKHQTRKKI